MAAQNDDGQTTLAALKQRVLSFAQEREWEQFHSPKNLSMALASEAAELMEHFLWSQSGADQALFQDEAKMQNIRQELADIFIYGLEFANVTGIDIAQAINDKMLLNAQKYPVEKARGRSDKYTEL